MITVCRKAFFYGQFKLGNSFFFEVPLRDICSEHASELILKTILQTMNLSVSKISPAHQLAIPLLLMGFPFIKRDLLEANESLCSDPLLLITLKTKWVNSSELPEYLKPKPIGYKN